MGFDKLETDMDFTDDVKFSGRAEAIKKALVVILIMIVLAGAGGLFGYGKWTKFRISDASGYCAEYERFLRAKKETPLKIIVPPSEKSEIVILIEASYFEKVSLKKIIPEPLKTTCSGTGYIFHFPANGQTEKLITFNTVAIKAGNIRSAIKYENRELTIEQFIYP